MMEVPEELREQLEIARAEAERDGYTEIEGTSGLTFKIMCDRHAAMYEGCNREEVMDTIMQTVLEIAARSTAEIAKKHGLEEHEVFAGWLKEYAKRGKPMCCKFPDKMHLELVEKTRGN